jgi:signal transduction histidine kinase
VRLDLDQDARVQASREVQATAYRFVVEGLTSVRRHAGPAAPVTVSVVEAPDGTLSVVVRNEVDAGAGSLDGRLPHRGGTGLAALEERVSAVGGHLEAGPDDSGGWRLAARLPTTNQEGAS